MWSDVPQAPSARACAGVGDVIRLQMRCDLICPVLRALLGMHSVPDVEFVLNVDDYAKANKRRVPTAPGEDAPRVPLPLFSYSKRVTGLVGR